MRVWSIIFNMFGMLILLFMTVILYRDIKVNNKQLEEIHLNYAIDYATRAGFQSALRGGDLGIKYEDLQNANVDPENVLKVYKAVLLTSYDYALSDMNYASMDNYISSAVLAVDNGYYIASPRTDNDASLTWGIKKPYAIHYTNGSYVSYNLSNEKWVGVKDLGSSLKLDRGDSWTRAYQGNARLVAYTNTVPKRSEVTAQINRNITQDINFNIRERNKIIEQQPDGTDKKVYIGSQSDFVYLPAVQTATGINAITKPSLFTTLSNVDFAGREKIEAKSVGGTTLNKKKRVIAFIEDGKKYYCYEGQIDDAYKAVNMYNSTEEAARNGYYPSLKYLVKPIRDTN